MNSMTGYGVGECTRNGFKVTVELSSVNRRQSETVVYLPRELEVLEAQVREEINRRVGRGRVTVRVSLHPLEGREAANIHIHKGLARAYARELARLARELNLAGDVTLDHLLRAPGVLQNSSEWADAEAFWPAVRSSLQGALAGLLQMRAREGLCLEKDLRRRVAALRRSLARIARRAPRVLQRYRQQLQERLQNAGLDLAQVEEDRINKELIIFADRSDISEELTRLLSHFQQFDDYVKTREAVGRTLDFLAQEINREINTIGAKANDALIAREVVFLKTELEKFREQVQNIE
jgi:uncharacterized protein (TIGR00255 family)